MELVGVGTTIALVWIEEEKLAGRRYGLLSEHKQLARFDGTLYIKLSDLPAYIAGTPPADLDRGEVPDTPGATPTYTLEKFKEFLDSLLLVTGTLGMDGVERDQVEPAKLTNKLRVAKGKLPFCSYTIVRIDVPKFRALKRAPLGGTHAPPREHERQGHYSHSKYGKRFWVPKCTVNKDKGMGKIDHTYEIRGQPNGEHPPSIPDASAPQPEDLHELGDPVL
jgi:hypothetical protein